MALRSRKRQRVLPVSDVSKRRKVDTFADVGTAELATRHTGRFASSGTVLTLGTGDTGQLGLGPDITERMKPALMPPASLSSAGLDQDSAEDFIQVVAGGMHTVCLTSDGRVFTFGCNDEGALGRPSGDSSSDNDDGKPKTESVEESRPGVVNFPENCVKIKMVSAGDSHSAALDNQGRVWLWGTFRGASGAIGLTKAGEICCSPVHLASLTAVVVKITSGQDHLVCLTDDGRLFTIGCGEQGQLGRIAERFAKDGGRSGIDFLLQPGECRLRGSKRFVDVWAGGFATIARMTSGVIYACGLNNYGQLALVKQKPERDKEMEVGETIPENTESVTELEKLSESMLSRKQGPLVQFMLTPACGFDPETDWTQFAIGMHHTLALTAAGAVYAVGRSDYGRLGISSDSDIDASAVSSPKLVQGTLCGRKCSWVACGEACSFAIDEHGKAFSWGMGSNQQLAHEEESEDAFEPGEMVGKNLSTRRIVMIDAGGQHVVMLAQDPSRTMPESKESEPGEMQVDSVSTEVKKYETNGIHTGVAPMDTSSTSAQQDDASPNSKDLPDKPILDTLNAPQPPPEVASTAGATVNSSSLHSCSLVASDQSSLSSAHSTDGGGSSRLGSSLFAQPVDAPTLQKVTSATTGPNCGGSTTSTSEPGFPLTDGGSMTASPADTH